MTTTSDDPVDCGCLPGDTGLQPLDRNKFFPRKPMEVRHWQAEQDYHRHSRELVTRQTVGTGVLCGLAVERTADGAIVLRSGTAIDGSGRTIIVPEDIEINVTILTDDCGRPIGRTEGAVTISVCAHECGIDPVAVDDKVCGDQPVLVPSMIRETFAVMVQDGITDRVRLPEEWCDLLSQCGLDISVEDFHEEFDQLAPRGCACGPLCVPVAVVNAGVITDIRQILRSNAELTELVMCLADRMVQQPCPITAPHVVQMWPRSDDTTSVDQFLADGRLEIAFDRDIAEQGLDDPSAWFGVWLVNGEMASRLPITRASGSLEHVTVPLDGDAAAYLADLTDQPLEGSVYIMIRSTVGGPIHANDPDAYALDADLVGSAFSEETRTKLWALPADGSSHVVDVFPDPITVPPLPSGDGQAGGDLHIEFPITPIAGPPQVLAVWPSGIIPWDDTSHGDTQLDRPRLEILISRAISDVSLIEPSGWLRLWFAPRPGPASNLAEMPLGDGTAELLADGKVRLTFAMDSLPNSSTGVVQLRSTGPVNSASPVGKDNPSLLLDANGNLTDVVSQDLFTLWKEGTLDHAINVTVQSTEGLMLYDGKPGGVAAWAFEIEDGIG